MTFKLTKILLVFSYIWNTIYLVLKYLFSESEEIIDNIQLKLLKTKINLPNIIPDIISDNNNEKTLNTLTTDKNNTFDTIHLINNTNHRAKEITILNWNIHYFTNNNNKCSFVEQFEYLQDKRPDVICLQEVKCKTFTINNKSCNQLQCIANKLGYYYVHINELAVLSKFKIQKHKFISHYPTGNSFGNRSIIFEVVINYRIITILNIHLHNDIFGLEQLNFYEEYLQKIIDAYNKKNKPLILCGDFNSLIIHPILYKIRNQLQITNINYEDYPNTFPTNYPLFQLDKCYSNEYYSKVITLLNSNVDKKCNYSDHFPVLSRFNVSS